MKKLLSLTLIMLITLSNIYTISSSRLLIKKENSLNTKSLKTEIKKTNKNTSNSKNEPNSTRVSEKTETDSEAEPKKATVKSINSLGIEVEGKTIIDKEPYKLDRCDQTVTIETDYVVDLEDFTVRKKGYFTITAHMINRFEKKDVSKLDQSIMLEAMRVPINEPQGAQNCLFIDGGSYEKAMLICLKNKEEFESFKTIFDDFKDCRNGKILGKVDVAQEKKDLNAPGPQDLKKSCGFDGPMASPDEIINALDGKKKEEEMQDVDFWIPGGHNVPGTKNEEKK